MNDYLERNKFLAIKQTIIIKKIEKTKERELSKSRIRELISEAEEEIYNILIPSWKEDKKTFLVLKKIAFNSLINNEEAFNSLQIQIQHNNNDLSI